MVDKLEDILLNVPMKERTSDDSVFQSKGGIIPDDAHNFVEAMPEKQVMEGSSYDPGLEFRKAMSPIFDMAANGDIEFGNNYMQTVKEDEDLNFKRVRQLTNDLSRVDSADRALLDILDKWNYNSIHSRKLTTQEANQMTKDLGVDMKWDKPDYKITEGDVLFAVDRAKKKEAIEKELAFFQENADYSALQKARLIGSSIAGSVGPMELAGTIALSAVGAPAWAALSTKINAGVNAAKGVYNLHKAEVKARCALSLANSLRDYGEAYKIARTAGGIGESKALTFAMDGVVSDLPNIAFRRLNSEYKNDGSFETKDALTEMLVVGAFSGALGKAVDVHSARKAARLKTAEAAQQAIDKEAVDKVQQALLKGHDLEAEEATAKAQGVSAGLEKVASEETGHILDERAATAYAEQMDECSKLNLTDDEVVFITQELYRRAKQGLPLNVLEEMPFRTTYYSNMTSYLDNLKIAADQGLTEADFFGMMAKAGKTAEYTGLKTSTDALGQVREFLSTLVPVGVKFKEEGGALGRLVTRSLSKESAEKLHFNTAKSLMLDGISEESEVARQIANEQLVQLIQIRKCANEIAQTYNDIQAINKAARAQGKSPVFKYKATKSQIASGQGLQDQYMLSNGSFGTLIDALADLADNLMPASLRKEIAEAEEIFNREMSSEYLVGHGAGDDRLEEAKNVLAMRDQWRQEVIDTFSFTEKGKDGYTYLNLKHMPEGIATKGLEQTDTQYLNKMTEVLDDMIRDDVDLLNTDKNFMYSYGENPEKLISMIEEGTDIPELGYSLGSDSISHMQVQELVNSESGVAERLAASQATFDMNKESTAVKSLDTLSTITEQQVSTGARKASIPWVQNSREIVALDKILATSFNTIRDGIKQGISGSKFIAHMADISTELTPRVLGRLVTDERKAFREIIDKAVFEPIRVEFPGGLVSDLLDEEVNKAIDNFVHALQKQDTPQAKSIFSNIDLNEADMLEGAADNAIVKRHEQNKGYDEMLEPLIKELGIAAATYKTALLQSQNLTVSAWTECLKHPGRMDEIMLSIVSGTHINAKGTGMTIEKLAGTQKEYASFISKLKQLDTEKGAMPLETYAYDANNFEQIRDSMFDKMAIDAGTATKEEELAYQAGSQASRVAQAYLDTTAGLQRDLFNAGAGRKSVVSFFDGLKLRSPASYLKGVSYEGKPIHDLCSSLAAKIAEGKGFPSYEHLARFLPRSGDKADLGRSATAMFLLEHLDLDNMFNRSGFSKVSLNSIRDFILGNAGKGESVIDDLYKQYGSSKIDKALQMIADGIQGNPTNYGLIDKMMADKLPITAQHALQKSKYLRDMAFDLKFKSNGSYKEAMKYWGYDDMRSMFEGNISRAKKAYSVLSLAGAEPFQFFDNLVEMGRTYATHVAPKELGAKAGKMIQERMGSATFTKTMDFIVNNVCGTYSSPATGVNKAFKLAIQAMGAPLIMMSSVKGLTDFPIMFQYLVSAGLYQGGNVPARFKIARNILGILPNSKNRRLMGSLFINQHMGLNTLYEIMTNGNNLVAGGGGIKDVIQGFTGKNLSKYASLSERAEAAIKSWTNTVMSMGFVSQAAEYNRACAALSTMEAIGTVGNKAFAELDKRWINSLARYGIDEFEWDNIFRAKGIMNSDEYIKMTSGMQAELFGEGEMFIPDLITRIDDNTIAGFMKAQPDKFPLINNETIMSYRNNLADKAHVLINASADEMTSIPTARIQGMLIGYNDPNTRAAALARAVTQFQSFGASMNWISWSRRWMSYADPEDRMLTQFIMGRNGWGKPTLSMTGFITELAMTQWMLNEGISYVAGNHQKVMEDGEIQWDRVGKKTGKALVDQAGLAGIVLDTVMGLAGTGAGSGGGLAVPVAPVPASMMYGGVKVGKAMLREENEGRRLQAGLAQVGMNTAETLGIARHPLTKATYSWLIGDKWSETAMGEKAWRSRTKRREREGYQENFMYDVSDSVGDLFTK